jgi:hypothetical protein
MGEEERTAARELSLRGVRPPTKVPGYEQEQFLGHGAYGEVWVAVNRNSGRKVAIKFYTRRGGLDWSGLTREVEKLRYLFSDRYVVQLFEVGWEADPPYYVMEFMENGSLEDLLRGGPLHPHDAVTYFREIAVALVHAHDKGILHCDLKPGNVLLDHDRRPRLADFGQSRLTNEVSPALGTLYYMAPEQADLAATPDARWDVYALGAVVYRMLTGEPPHYQNKPPAEGNLESQLVAYRKHILSAPRPDAHRKVPGVDAELASVVDRCLEPSPAKRFANPQAVVTALDAWSLRRVRRSVLIFTVLGFLLLFLVMAGVGQYLFRTSVATAREGVIGRTLEGNRFAARAEAQQLATEIEHRWRVLEFEAASPQLRKWLAAGDDLAADPTAVERLDEWLTRRREKYNKDFRKRAEASLWIALDAGGKMRGMSPSFPQYRHRYFGFRDYFTGKGYNSAVEHGPPESVITAPYRSLVYRRRSTKTWTVTFSVPVPDEDPKAPPVGVLAMSVDLTSEAPAGSPSGLKRFSVLIDARPDANRKPGLVVHHPYMATLPADLDEENLPLYYADRLVEDAHARPEGWQTRPEYADPVDRGEFRGAWLAAVEPVVVRAGGDQPVDSGFLVVVQEKRDDVLDPVADLQWRLGIGATLGVAFLFLVLAVVWAGTVSVLDGAPKSRVTRLLRRWAGLPTGTAGTGTPGSFGTPGTAAVGSSVAAAPVAGAKTARIDVAATPDQGLGVGLPRSADGLPELEDRRRGSGDRNQETGAG